MIGNKKQIAENTHFKRTTTNETTLIHINQSACYRNLRIYNFSPPALFIGLRALIYYYYILNIGTLDYRIEVLSFSFRSWMLASHGNHAQK